jgi:hypothetical protein
MSNRVSKCFIISIVYNNAAFFAPPLFAAVKLNWCETPLRKIRAKRPVSNVSENLFCDKQLVLNFLRLAPLLK